MVQNQNNQLTLYAANSYGQRTFGSSNDYYTSDIRKYLTDTTSTSGTFYSDVFESSRKADWNVVTNSGMTKDIGSSPKSPLNDLFYLPCGELNAMQIYAPNSNIIPVYYMMDRGCTRSPYQKLTTGEVFVSNRVSSVGYCTANNSDKELAPACEIPLSNLIFADEWDNGLDVYYDPSEWHYDNYSTEDVAFTLNDVNHSAFQTDTQYVSLDSKNLDYWTIKRFFCNSWGNRQKMGKSW